MPHQRICNVVKVAYHDPKADVFAVGNRDEAWEVLQRDFRELGFPRINRTAMKIVKPGRAIVWWEVTRPGSFDDQITEAANVRSHQRSKLSIKFISSYAVDAFKFIEPLEYEDRDTFTRNDNNTPIGSKRRSVTERSERLRQWSTSPTSSTRFRERGRSPRRRRDVLSARKPESESTSSVDLTKETDAFLTNLEETTLSTMTRIKTEPKEPSLFSSLPTALPIKTEPRDDSINDLVDMDVDDEDADMKEVVKGLSESSLKAQVEQLQEALRREKERKERVELFISDIERELQAPFVVPAILSVMTLISNLTTEACQM